MSQYSVTQYGSHRGGYHSPYPIRPPPPGTHPPHLHMPMAPQFPQPFDPRQRQRFPPWQQEQPLPMENIGQFSVPLISGSQPFPPPYRPQPFSPGFSVGAPPSLMPPGVPPHSGQVGTGLSAPASESVDPFVADWLQSVGKRRSEVTSVTQKGLAIPEARRLLSRAVYLVTTLHSLHASLSMVANDDHSTWDHTWRQVHQCKDELEAIRGQLSEPAVMECLVRRVGRTAAKRERTKRARHIRKADKKERMTVAEERTDSWLRERRQEELKLKTEKSVQASARSVLEGVKRKQSEVRQYQDLLTALNQLREHRKEFRKKGDVLPPDTDEVYTQKFKTLENLLSKQIKDYEGEEHTLRVLMAEEVREKMSSQQKQEELTVAAPAVALPMGMPLSSADPANWHSEYWLQAEKSEELKTAIRQRWSCFEHPEGTPLLTKDETTAPAVCAPTWKQFIVHHS